MAPRLFASSLLRIPALPLRPLRPLCALRSALCAYCCGQQAERGEGTGQRVNVQHAAKGDNKGVGGPQPRRQKGHSRRQEQAQHTVAHQDSGHVQEHGW